MNNSISHHHHQIDFIAVRRMEQQVKVVLTEISEDPIRLGILITGKRVQLAEDLSKCCLPCYIFLHFFP